MYRVIELQTTGTATAMIDHNDFADKDHAESEAHRVAQYAAVSAVEVHTVAVVNPGIFLLKGFLLQEAWRITSLSL